MAKRSPRAAPAVKTPKRPTPPGLVPDIVAAATLDDHLEIITRAIFQSGLSWAMIADRWDGFRTAFEGFAVARVAAYGEFELDRLMTTDRLIHSRKKLTGTFSNAATLIALEREFGSIAGYVAAFQSYEELYADAHRRFAFMGDLNCYYWLFRTGNPVPLFDDWIARQAQDHPRMREMVMAGRASRRSPERTGF